MQAESKHELGAGGIVADVTVPADVERLVAYTAETFGGLDILITNAGGPPGGTFDSIGIEQWERGVEPEEFGQVAAFLVSPAASYVTGVMFQIDGGSYRGLL